MKGGESHCVHARGKLESMPVPFEPIDISGIYAPQNSPGSPNPAPRSSSDHLVSNRYEDHLPSTWTSTPSPENSETKSTPNPHRPAWIPTSKSTSHLQTTRTPSTPSTPTSNPHSAALLWVHGFQTSPLHLPSRRILSSMEVGSIKRILSLSLRSLPLLLLRPLPKHRSITHWLRGVQVSRIWRSCLNILTRGKLRYLLENPLV